MGPAQAAAETTEMTVELKRLNNAELNDIVNRLNTSMTDEGYRAWYRNDVNALLQEAMALRRERGAAMTIFNANPPLEGIDTNTSMAEVARRLTELWTQYRDGVWQRAEVKRIRESLASTKLNLATTSEDRDQQAVRIAQLKEEIAQLEGRLAEAAATADRDQALARSQLDQQLGLINGLEGEVRRLNARIEEAVAEGQRAVEAERQNCADTASRAVLLIQQATGLLIE